ncbi:MAG: hypothetical protein KDK70_07625 [Myxococcales bacterium]|nr:hypothetical protein [Myxococcales bacterium]
MPWPFSRKRPADAQPRAVDWLGGRFFAMPQEPRAGRFEGSIERVRTRTWAGCTFMPGEEEQYPEIPVLRLGDAFAPLKQAPSDAGLRADLQAQAGVWAVRSGYVGAGPPYVRDDDPWAELEPAAHAVVEGFWFPTFKAGTIQGWQIWGLYVRSLPGA